MAWLRKSVTIDNVSAAVVAAAVIGLLNALLWLLLSKVLVPFAILTLGIAALLLNGFLVWLAAEIVPGFAVAGF